MKNKTQDQSFNFNLIDKNKKLFKITIEFRTPNNQNENKNANKNAKILSIVADHSNGGGQCYDSIEPASLLQESLLHTWQHDHLTTISEQKQEEIIEKIEKLKTEHKEKIKANQETAISIYNRIIEEVQDNEPNIEEDAIVAYIYLFHSVNLKEETRELTQEEIEDIIEDTILNISEKYEGDYRTDEDFAEYVADSLACIDRSPSWPHKCIDWEQAARELMMDYYEDNGHYFSKY